MSAGAFLQTSYESDSGEVHPIRVQPETAAANFGGANAAPAGPITSSISARARGGIREYGLKARAFVIVFTGAVPDGYEPGNQYRIPVLTPARFNGTAIGTTGTYLGAPARVVSKVPERVR